MITIRDWIDAIKLPSEDASLKPQEIEASTPMLIHDYLMIARDSVMYLDSRGRELNNVLRDDGFLLKCVALEEADKNECPCNPRSGCTWLKSCDPLPAYKGDSLYAVTLTNQNKDIPYSRWTDMKDMSSSYSPVFSSGESCYTKKKFINGEFLYIETDLELDFVSVFLPITDFLSASSYSQCNDEEEVCNILDMNFYVPSELRLQVMQTTVALLSGFFSLSPISDTKTDGVDGSRNNGQS